MIPAKPTEGPYTAIREDGDLLIVAPDPERPGCIGILAQICSFDFPDQAEANARLFAAAPALLSIIKRIAIEAMAPPPTRPSSSSSWLPPEIVQDALQVIDLVEKR